MTDSNTGLTYMQQRYYDPIALRFLSSDPMPVDPGTAWNYNRYNYAAGNPYKYVDPSGQTIECTSSVCEIQCTSAFECGADYLAAGIIVLNAHIQNAASKPKEATQPSESEGEGQGEQSTPSESAQPEVPNIESADEIDPAGDGKLTRAGRAQQKHGDRGGAFEKATGTPDDKDQQGAQTVQEIMKSPDRVDEVHPKYGTDVRQTPDGRGARFGPDGTFRGFIEPRKK